MNNKFEKKLDAELEELLNSEISAPQYLVNKVNNHILHGRSSKKNKAVLTSFMPAAAIILANAIFVLLLMFNNLYFTDSLFERLLVIYSGFSALSLLGVFTLIAFELRSESEVKKNFIKTLGG